MPLTPGPNSNDPRNVRELRPKGQRGTSNDAARWNDPDRPLKADWPAELSTRLAAFHGWWRGLGDARVPVVSRIDPLTMPAHILPGVCIIELVGSAFERRVRYRLAGTEHRLMNGFELTGTWFEETHGPNVTRAVTRLYGRIADEGTPHYLRTSDTLSSEIIAFRLYTHYHRILCPIDIEATGERRLIGCWEWFRPSTSFREILG